MTYEFQWTFTDGTGPSGNQDGTLTVTNTNRPPTIDPIIGINTEPHVGETVLFDLEGTDPDDDVTIWGISSPDLGATIDQDGMFSWTPREEHANMQVLTFTLTDSIDLPVTAPVTFTVNPNNLPTFTSYTQTVSEAKHLFLFPVQLQTLRRVHQTPYPYTKSYPESCLTPSWVPIPKQRLV